MHLISGYFVWISLENRKTQGVLIWSLCLNPVLYSCSATLQSATWIYSKQCYKFIHNSYFLEHQRDVALSVLFPFLKMVYQWPFLLWNLADLTSPIYLSSSNSYTGIRKHVCSTENTTQAMKDLNFRISQNMS